MKSPKRWTRKEFKRNLIIGLIVFTLSALAAFLSPGTLYITNGDGTVLPPPAWGDYQTNTDKVGVNFFTYDLTNQAFWYIGDSNWFDSQGYLWAFQRSSQFTNITSWPYGRFTNTFTILSSTNNGRTWAPELFTVNEWQSADTNNGMTVMNYCREIFDAQGEPVWIDEGPALIQPGDGIIDTSVGDLFRPQEHGNKMFMTVYQSNPPVGIQPLALTQDDGLTNVTSGYVVTNGNALYLVDPPVQNPIKPLWFWIVVFVVAVGFCGWWFGRMVKRWLEKPVVMTSDSPTAGGGSPGTNAPPSDPSGY